MPATLQGGDAATFDDPIAMLSACHGRIRKQLATLARLEHHLPEHGHDEDARAAARAILRYFDTAAANHHQDEESSLFPRLLARAPEARELASRLLAEHVTLADRWTKLRPLLAGIATGQRAVLPPRLVREVTAAYEAHMTLEDDELLPLAEETLTKDEVAAIGREMAQRRGVAASARGPEA